MQENNLIYEITQQMQNKETVQNDIKEAVSLVADLFKKKYINKIEMEIQNEIKNIEKTPPKEVTLLNALKPFFNEDLHNNIDNTINLITKFSAVNSFKNIMPKSSPINDKKTITINSLSESDPSVKEDGVYDIDQNCLLSMNSNKNSSSSFLTLILVMFLFFQN